MTDRLRLRISPCPNDTFMFEALLNGRIPTQGLAFEAVSYTHLTLPTIQSV